jgi:hypothetical protein
MPTNNKTDPMQAFEQLLEEADRDWHALMAQHDKPQDQPPPGMVYQTQKVKRGKRWVQERRLVEEPVKRLEKLYGEPEMKKKQTEEIFPAQRDRAIDAVLAPLNRVADEIERKWGFDRLPTLVPEDMALRFASAKEKLSEAIAANDVTRIKERAEIMRRGWEKLDETATAAGHEPWAQTDVWEGRRPDGKVFLIAKDKTTAVLANRDTAYGVWTVQEIGMLLQQFDPDGFTQAIKEEFQGELVSITKEKPKAKEIVEI